MIYFTGDTHGDLDINKIFPNSLRMRGITVTDKDHILIAGDFGLPFLTEEAESFEQGDGGTYGFCLNRLSVLPCKILWIDGNHENHDWWAQQPVTEMFGGRVQIHPHSQQIIHLMRGEVYEIDGRTLFTFGGAVSVDKEYRTEGYSWWAAEQASDEDIANAEKNLDRVGRKVDFIVTHTMPMSIIKREGWEPVPDRGADYLDKVMHTVEFKAWVCGHFHVDRLPGNNICMLYNEVVSADTIESILERRKGY
ncbi:MAG: metallophosphoesterase [Ruminococcus sp.]|nr:metallophosphoesterase [Ruminococcus sp.]